MPVFFKDRAGVYRGCNQAFAAMLGLPIEQIVGRSVADLSPPDLAQVYMEADEAMMQAGVTQRYESQVLMAEGGRRDVIFSKSVLRDAAGQVNGLVGTITDITEHKLLQARLADMAMHDELTGLLNRRALLAEVERRHADRRGGRQALCVLMCDLDHFKRINDTHGHAVGDEVLRQVAQVLRQGLREGDRVGRLGGEEFMIVLDDADTAQAMQAAGRLRQSVAEARWRGDAQALSLTISVGVAQSKGPHEPWAEALRRADEALYKAKRQGRNRVELAD